MSVYFLTSNDFEARGDDFFYRNAKPELTLVLFYTNDCPHCKPILPLFQQLAARLQGCKYALMNVGENYAGALLSRKTNTPINYVPFVLLYYNGTVLKQFKAQYTFDNLRDFLVEAAKELHTVAPATGALAPAQAQTPGFTTGTPYCDDESGVCYVSFDAAYKKVN